MSEYDRTPALPESVYAPDLPSDLANADVGKLSFTELHEYNLDCIYIACKSMRKARQYEGAMNSVAEDMRKHPLVIHTRDPILDITARAATTNMTFVTGLSDTSENAAVVWLLTERFDTYNYERAINRVQNNGRRKLIGLLAAATVLGLGGYEVASSDQITINKFEHSAVAEPSALPSPSSTPEAAPTDTYTPSPSSDPSHPSNSPNPTNAPTEPNPTEWAGDPDNIRMTTFNIRHSTDPPAKWKARLRLSADILLGRAPGMGGRAIDVAGLQEVRPDQMRALNTPRFGSKVFDMYPNTTERPEFSPNPIIWNEKLFKPVWEGWINIKYFGGHKEQVPIVKLEVRKTGDQFYFANTHDPANVRGPAARWRYENAVHYGKYFKNLIKESKTRNSVKNTFNKIKAVIFGGDFNAGYTIKTGTKGNDTLGDDPKKLTIRVIKAMSGLRDAYEIYKHMKGNATGITFEVGSGNTVHRNPPDHLVMRGITGAIAVVKFFGQAGGKFKNGSDVHDTIIADVILPD